MKAFLAAGTASVRYNAPLGAHRVADLVRRLAPTGPDWRALDLGCGNGELLMQLCESFGIGGDGVERDAADGERARLRAAERGLSGQVTFHSEGAGAWRRPADLVVNVGAGYIWGDTGEARRLGLL